MSAYVARARSSPHWRDFDTATLRISVGYPNFEAELLEAQLAWLCTHDFSDVKLLLSDELQRHNLMTESGLDETHAQAEALALGSAWLERHEDSIQAARKEVRTLTVLRWHALHSDEDYPERRAQAQRLYDEDASFQDAIREDLKRFARAKSNPAYTLENPAFVRNSTNYLLEEIALHDLLLERYGGCQVYPSPPLQSEQYLQTLERPDILYYQQSNNYIALKLERRPGQSALNKPHTEAKTE